MENGNVLSREKNFSASSVSDSSLTRNRAGLFLRARRFENISRSGKGFTASVEHCG